jgi:hypothetical protein
VAWLLCLSVGQSLILGVELPLDAFFFRKGPTCALSGIVVERQAAIVESTHQRGPARPHVAQSLGELGFGLVRLRLINDDLVPEVAVMAGAELRICERG